MRFSRFSIRFRMTLWYTAVLLLIIAAAGAAIYLFMHNRLESMVESKAEAGYATVETVVINSGGDIYDIVHLGQETPFLLIKEGKAVHITTAWSATGLPITIGDSLSGSFGFLESSNGKVYAIRRGIIADYDYGLVYVQDATETSENLRFFVGILLAAFVAALIAGPAGGYFLAGRVLSPIRAISDGAREITADSLSRRLPVINPHDEIGILSTVFNETLERLDESFKRLRRFTADASHELRTPVAAIRTVGEVALQGPADSTGYGEAISNMLVETERLSQLLDSLLTLARGDADKVRPDFQAVDLSELAREVAEELGVLAEEKGQTLKVAAGSPVAATVDRKILRLALINVLHNALKFAPVKGQVEVTVINSESGGAVVDIADDGPGIAKEEQEKVFERFYRVDKARSRESGGSGLGLAIAAWAVEINRGKIEFVDRDGRPGACCRITFPAGD